MNYPIRILRPHQTKCTLIGRLQMSIDFQLVMTMADKANLKAIGLKVRKAREQLDMTQAELGAALWPKLKPSASQSRVYRIESGTYQLDYNSAHRLFEQLAIHDVDAETLAVSAAVVSKPLTIHRKLAVRYPELHHYLALINAAAVANRFEEVAQLVSALPHIFRNDSTTEESLKQINGEIDPFPNGGQR